MDKLEKLIIDSRFAHKEIQPDLTASAEERWEEKDVKDFYQLYDGKDLENITLHGIGSVELSDELTHSGNKCILLSTNTDIEDIRPRPFSSIHFTITNNDWTKYNRLSLWVYPKSTGFQNFYFHLTIFTENNQNLLHAPSLTPNQWNHIVWEFPHLQRENVIKFSMGPLLMGCPPEAKPDIKVFFDDIQLQKVEEDYVEGWNVDDRIAYCHSGYFLNAEKIAITQKVNSNEFKLYSEKNEEVFIGKVEDISSDIGHFYKLDFSNFKEDGIYYLKVDDRTTPLFIIDDNPYQSSIWKSLNFLRMLRCGEDIEGVHSACHINNYTMHPDGRMLPNHGGWHDAGDVSQFEICTAEMAHALVDLAQNVLKDDLALGERILEEARYGLNWLLRTRFGDGYRALAVHYSIWQKNVVNGNDHFSKDNPKYNNNTAENGPFENFCAAAAEAAAARVFKDIDPIFADWCLRSAIEDFWFGVVGYNNGIYTKRWGPGPDAQVCGEGALAAAEIYAITKDIAFIEQGAKYANIVLGCQQSEMPDWNTPIRGFFYEDLDHSKLLTYEHRGHEQTPVHGLCRLYEVVENHVDKDKWLQGIQLYAEYITSTADLIAPYNLLPAHIYIADKLNMIRFTIPKSYGTEEEAMASFKRQIANGIKLNEGVYLRRLPIAIQRRGFHATLLSKVKGVTEIAKVLKDDKLKQIAINQLEWILGKNPFSTSTMYGEGHNYHPLYVAFSRQIVGSLPVGFKTLDDFDAPYWPVINNAVFKEIWGHTSGKYLWVLADLI